MFDALLHLSHRMLGVAQPTYQFRKYEVGFLYPTELVNCYNATSQPISRFNPQKRSYTVHNGYILLSCHHGLLTKEKKEFLTRSLDIVQASTS